MTALTKFDRLEASALWRPQGETQRVEVIVSMGDATLTISNLNEQPLSHWSLPAIERINGTNERLAIYAPGPDTDERLETEDETMIAAIARIQRAIERGTARQGRVRGGLLAGVCVGMLAIGIFWLPGALVRQATSIVPDVTRNQIGASLLSRLERLSGRPCQTPQGTIALRLLNARLSTNPVGEIVVLRSGLESPKTLPGGYILLDRSVIEDHEDPDVVAGYVLAEQQRAQDVDPLEHLLQHAGFLTPLKLLTSGHIPDAALDSYAEDLLRETPAPVAMEALVERFAKAEVRSLPYAQAIDITGAETLPLIEADAVRLQSARPVLTDGQWVALQNICGG
ncbi:hypothetical protein [Pacificibacter sp.]|uniref:hypothetical protein n=1 Tax=Pacificibacter sp. TaxID=1917866 RepID=UPI003219947B